LNGDLYTIYYPLYSFAYRGAELLPAWNPYQLAGTPTVGYLAGGLYYPPNWLSVAVPVHRTLRRTFVARGLHRRSRISREQLLGDRAPAADVSLRARLDTNGRALRRPIDRRADDRGRSGPRHRHRAPAPDRARADGVLRSLPR